MQFYELLRASPRHTHWTVFVWQSGKYRQFEPKVNRRSAGFTALDQTTDFLLKNKPELVMLYVHWFETTERGYMNVYIADWKLT